MGGQESLGIFSLPEHEMEAVANELIPAEGAVALEGTELIASGDQYLAFSLGSERYAVDILAVKEIRGWEAPTMIPQAPAFVRGVINLRGLIVPILDLRLRFKVGEAVYEPTTVVIVLAVEHEGRSRMMGFVVDAVSDVLNADEQQIKAVPPFGGEVPTRFLKGLLNVDDDVVTLLHVEPLMQLDE